MSEPRNNEEQPPQPPTPGRRRPGQSWDSIIDEKIRKAQEQGDFDNLSGAGRPIPIDENPYAGDKAMAYSVLKSNNAAPAEVAYGQEVDALLMRAETIRAELRSRRAVFVSNPRQSSANIRAFNKIQDQYAARYASAVREARSKGLSLNIIAPAALHRPLIDANAMIASFQEEFPPLAER